MRRKLVVFSFLFACCLFSAPQPAQAKMECWAGGTVMTYEGIPMCAVFESTGDCEWCVVTKV
jgi:hypothetical protein